MLNLISSSLLMLGTPAQADAPTFPDSPNIIFVFPDQWRGTALGYRGIEPVKTPNLDRFAAESADLRQCASNYPVCSPYRAMLMSGQYSFKNGVFGNCQSVTAPLKCELPTDAVCWSDVLKSNGYSLGYIGKWHLDAPYKPFVNTRNNNGQIAWNEWCPPNRRHGFDYWHAYGTYDNHMNPMYWAKDSKREDFKFAGMYGPKYEVDRAIEFINNTDGTYRDSEKPFALVISMNPPHTGYEAVPQKYKKMYADLDVEAVAKKLGNVLHANTPNGRFFRNNVRNYYAQMTAVDEQFGRLLAHLKANGLDSNTVVIFTSDHGDCMGMNDCVGKNVAYETAMSVPCFIRWPGHIPASADTTLFLSSPDFAPTMLGLAGLSARIPTQWDGVNYANYLRASTPGALPDGQLYIFITDGGYPKREKTLNLDLGRRGWRNAEWTYYFERREGAKGIEVLYNRVKDPAQLKNVASENPAICKALRERTQKELLRVGDTKFRFE